jgi:hypothetical protein
MSKEKQPTKTTSRAIPSGTQPDEILVPSRPMSDVEIEALEERLQKQARLRLANLIASSLLKNPNVEKFCYGSPLEPHHCGGEASVGAYLARECLRLADDYLAEIKKRTEPQKEPDAPTAPTFANEEPETLTDDYPDTLTP